MLQSGRELSSRDVLTAQLAEVRHEQISCAGRKKRKYKCSPSTSSVENPKRKKPRTRSGMPVEYTLLIIKILCCMQPFVFCHQKSQGVSLPLESVISM